MRSSGVRTAAILVAAMTALLGLLFCGQGLGVVPGSFMTGDLTWFWIGLAMVVVAAVVIVLALRRGPTARP